jgi:Transposase
MSNAIARTSDQITIGIDISKDRLDVHLHPDRIVKQFDNDRKGIARLVTWITPYQPTRIIFEATGAYHRALEMALGKAVLPAVKINPLQARRFAEATGKRVKTDPVDAAMLARFGATMQPGIPPARDETMDGLGELLAARRALVKDRTAALNRGKSLTLALLKRQSQQHLTQIQTQIEAIDQERATILRPVPGSRPDPISLSAFLALGPPPPSPCSSICLSWVRWTVNRQPVSSAWHRSRDSPGTGKVKVSSKGEEPASGRPSTCPPWLLFDSTRRSKRNTWLSEPLENPPRSQSSPSCASWSSSQTPCSAITANGR